MIEETMKKYYEATGDMPPMIMCLGNIYEDDYKKLLEKAIERKKPLTEDEIDEFLEDKQYDMYDEEKDFIKGFKNGLGNK